MPYALCLPREIHISDSPAYFTGVAKSDCIGGDRLDLLHQSHVNPLGFHALCSMRSALCATPSVISHLSSALSLDISEILEYFY